MPASVTLELQIAGENGGMPPGSEMQDWLREALRVARPDDDGHYELVVRVVDLQESRELNHRYRHKDKPTNVLAFPAPPPGDLGNLPEESLTMLGDLVLCGPVIEREAARQDKSPRDHWAHILVHGALHLLGFDHETTEQAARMEALEARILAGRGVADPYVPR